MLDALKQMFHNKDATLSYPVGGPTPRPANYRGRPNYDPNLCICCAACTNQCPPNAIQIELDMANGTETWSINYGRCIFCGRCQEVCPTTAITLSEDIELAVLEKEDLEVTAQFELQRCASCGKYYATCREVDYVTRVLSDGEGEMTEEDAKFVTCRCNECKTKADALRAKFREATTGQPAAYTADEALRDVYGAPVLNTWAAETEAGDVAEENDDLVIEHLVKTGLLTRDAVQKAKESISKEVDGK